MWQALCLTGRGVDTCWRPGNIAKNVVVCYGISGIPYTRVRLNRAV